jgi:hypothetical protein
MTTTPCILLLQIYYLNVYINVCSISGKVDNSVKQMGRLLSEIKGGGQGQAISKSGQRIKQLFSSTTYIIHIVAARKKIVAARCECVFDVHTSKAS